MVAGARREKTKRLACTQLSLVAAAIASSYCDALCSCWPSTTKAVPRVSLKEYHESIVASARHRTPIVVENVISAQLCEALCDEIIKISTSSQPVTLQRRRIQKKIEDDGDAASPSLYSTVTTDLYQVDSIVEAAGYIARNSCHDDALFVFEETLISSDSPLRQQLNQIRESVFVPPSLSPLKDQHDWFAMFPQWAVASDCCVVMAGEGATSTLHRDPYEWTGTSVCLEGSKVWRFIEPPSLNETPDDTLPRSTQGVHVVDKVLQSYRLPSIAWQVQPPTKRRTKGETKETKKRRPRLFYARDNAPDPPAVYVSAGWQSDFSLFASRSGNVPTASDLHKMFENDDASGLTSDDQKKTMIQYLHQIGASLPMLSPSPEIVSACSNGTLAACLWTAIQGPGDFLIIPAHWWHQTYGLEPSVAIASQRCSREDVPNVFRHIVATVGAAKSTGAFAASALPPLDETSSLYKDFFIDYKQPNGTVERFFELVQTEIDRQSI
jgi:hypothetical protein